MPRLQTPKRPKQSHMKSSRFLKFIQTNLPLRFYSFIFCSFHGSKVFPLSICRIIFMISQQELPHLYVQYQNIFFQKAMLTSYKKSDQVLSINLFSQNMFDSAIKDLFPQRLRIHNSTFRI